MSSVSNDVLSLRLYLTMFRYESQLKYSVGSNGSGILWAEFISIVGMKMNATVECYCCAREYVPMYRICTQFYIILL